MNDIRVWAWLNLAYHTVLIPDAPTGIEVFRPPYYRAALVEAFAQTHSLSERV